MKLTRLSEIRRKELRRAAFAVLQKEGLAGTTLERVAAQAGASKGIVLHYFADKKELFEHVLRESNSELGEAVAARLALAVSPAERLHAIVAANFEERFFRPAVCQAWVSLCAEVPRNTTFARIQRVIHGRMHSNLRTALKGLVPEGDIESVAIGISTLIDGLWLRRSVAPAALPREEALRQMAGYVKSRTGVTLALLGD